MDTKKDAILEKVLQILKGESEHTKLTIANIAELLDIGKSTIYEYFPSKEALIRDAMLKMIHNNQTLLIDESDLTMDNFKDALFAFLRRTYQITKQTQMLESMLYHSEIRSIDTKDIELIQKEILSTYKDTKEHLYKIFAIGYKESTIKEVDEKRIKALESLLFGFVLAAHNPLNNWEFEDIIEDIYESVLLLANN